MVVEENQDRIRIFHQLWVDLFFCLLGFFCLFVCVWFFFFFFGYVE